MTDCPRGDIRDLLPDLVHDQLGAESRAEVERHVATCAECSAEVALLRSARRVLSAGPRVDVARIAAAVAGAHGAGALDEPSPTVHRLPARRRRSAWEWRAAAGIAAVAVGIMSYALGRGHAPISSPTMPARSGVAPTSRQVARAADVAHGLMFAGGVSDLPDSAVRALIQSVDDLQAVPEVDPSPLLDPISEGAL
jgi:anti-sigma factor RsiW